MRIDTLEFLREVNHRYQPNQIVILADGGAGQAYFTRKIEFFKDFHLIDEKATAYVCQNYTCQSPTNDLVLLSRLLDKASPVTDHKLKQDAPKQ